MKRNLRKLVPKSLRPRLRKAWEYTTHRYQTRKLFGPNADFIPPRAMMFDGPAGYREFKENGEEFLSHYIELGGLKPDERMLDIGAGLGRKTLPLVGYLSERGSYEGMDIVKSGVDWCAEKYTHRYPNFKFQLIDVYNQMYNPEGRYRPSEYKLPFPDEEFDFAVLNSVFTHMLPGDVKNYLAEIARVLKTDGRCLISFFLLNDESRALVAKGRSTLDLRHNIGKEASVLSREMPERAVGYQEEFVRDLYAEYGLEIRQLLYGSWCGRTDFFSYQDQIVAFKRDHANTAKGRGGPGVTGGEM